MNVIKVENISKLYQLGQVGTGSIFHDVNRWWHGVRGKEDPYMRVGEENDRTKNGDSDYVWALKDINFEVAQGEVLGIIGRNGAGKSTLLKILSRTTAPTTGSIKVKGRIASLLEVGTGFHPELSGRDNIFMNGTILGMTRAEIKSKFDEIVEFAGIARYLDTPVKRYSSGMYVRLAFAVAAHLESEILIVDEVLAVGDHEFQKKCLGKMKDVSKQQGRTVLFVSHNMQAITNLSTKLIALQNGLITAYSNPIDGIEDYNSKFIAKANQNDQNNLLNGLDSNDFIKIKSLYLTGEDGIKKSTFFNSEKVCLNLECEITKVDPLLVIGMGLYNADGVNIFWSINLESNDPLKLDKGSQKIQMIIPSNFLNSGKYSIELIVALHNVKWIYRPNHNAPIINFSLVDQCSANSVWAYNRQGCLISNIEYKKAENWVI